ncbi:hypothetical protein IFM58399_05861 [Aspergillus lentulus]|uniref:Myo-inositol transporter 1 n=1 Tax=Aspergillus lentulus TaxID=293939 RepID=UPI001395612E|nr:uncharacterized protein IFM58399_05861 [Aspergillus lentulus]GFF40258.1 hypothetical protein IFM58399_05861 [Aspergillus lentulus]GFG07174.1 hypothetical protein IFM61392_04721 [Aspergillus lentulus]
MASCLAVLLSHVRYNRRTKPLRPRLQQPRRRNAGHITALYDIGCVVGSIVCYPIGEQFGRRTMLMAGGAIVVIGTVVLGSSYMIAQLIAGRIITGFGNGMTSSTAPVYQSECSPAWIRGALLTL